MGCMTCSYMEKVQKCGWICLFVGCCCIFGLGFSNFLIVLEDFLNVSSAANIYFIGGVIVFTLLFILIKMRMPILEKCCCYAFSMEESPKNLNALELQNSAKKSRNFFFRKRNKSSPKAEDTQSDVEDNHLANSSIQPNLENSSSNIPKYQSVLKYETDRKMENAPLHSCLPSTLQEGTTTNTLITAAECATPKEIVTIGLVSDLHKYPEYLQAPAPTPTPIETFMMNPSHQKQFSPVYNSQEKSEDRFKKKSKRQIYTSNSDFDSSADADLLEDLSVYNKYIKMCIPKRTQSVDGKSTSNDEFTPKHLNNTEINDSVEQWLVNVNNKLRTHSLHEYNTSESD